MAQLKTFRVWYQFLGEDSQYARLIPALTQKDAEAELHRLMSLEDEKAQVTLVEALTR